MHISVSEPWFSEITKGTKTCECRLRKGKFTNIQAGCQLHIIRKDDSDMTIVKNIHSIAIYPTFQECLAHEGIQSTLPGISNEEQGLSIYRQFYSSDEERKFGVIALKIV